MSATEREFAFTDQDFRFIAKLAGDLTGIVLNDQKRDLVYGRLARRLRSLELQNFAQYCELVRSDAGKSEIDHLVNAITTNLTSFFRESHHFDHLKDVIAKTDPGKGTRLRFWSSACSSGMEPYSMAMTILDNLPKAARWDAKILATDIDSNMLGVCKKAQYPANATESVPKIHQHHILTSGNQVTMAPAIRDMIAFKQLNLLDDWPMKGPFDAVFCRNVVIYFDKPTKKHLFARMKEIIRPGGYLYIGHSENLNGICDGFELIGRTIYRRLK